MTTYHLLFYFQFPNILEFQNKKNLLIILLSGIIGIGFGDNFLFLALKILGSQKLLILETMCPTLTCIIAYFYLGNPILFYQYIGIFITIFGIYLVIITNKSLPLEEKLIINNLEYLKNLHNKPEFKGYIYSFIFNICTVFGGIMSY
jgi:DME family drug/metabolite transporter